MALETTVTPKTAENAEITIEEALHDLDKEMEQKGLVSCIRSRLRLLFCPIRRWETVYKKCGDAETHFEIHPEAFRMLFYIYFTWFLIAGFIVTMTWSDFDPEDNPVLNRFGTNSPCVYFDDPPFALFASTLWYPAQILLTSFELFDYIRVRDHYLDGDDRYPVSKGFFVYYTISTVFESISVICFGQIFATSPTEHIYMHTWPFIMLMFTMWLLVLKRFLYLRKVNIVPWYGSLYVFALAISTAIMLGNAIPNLYGARLWETQPWTNYLAKYNQWTLLSVGGPLVIYAVIGKELDTVVFTMNRKNK